MRVLPPDQELPKQPPEDVVLAEVRRYLVSHGLAVADPVAERVVIGGEFLERASLKEGRVGLYQNLKVVSFLRRYADGSMRAVVLIPREGWDARMLGMAIFFGLVTEVPEEVAQSEVVSVSEFFKISTFDLSKMVDVPALERFKSEYRKSVDAELRKAIQRYKTAEAKLAKPVVEKDKDFRIPRPPRRVDAMLPRVWWTIVIAIFVLGIFLLAYWLG